MGTSTFLSTSSRIPPPSHHLHILILHILILVFPRPHDLPSYHSSNMKSRGHEPEDNQNDRQSTTDTIDDPAAEDATDLNGCQCETGVGKDKRPPVEGEMHFADAGKHCDLQVMKALANGGKDGAGVDDLRC